MTRTRTKRAAAVLGIVATAVLMASPASADVVVNESYEFAYSQVIDDHCDVEGFTVEQSGVVEGRFRIIARGPNGFEYAADTARFADKWTNVDTGDR